MILCLKYFQGAKPGIKPKTCDNDYDEQSEKENEHNDATILLPENWRWSMKLNKCRI
jgi:hypothetical protein